VPSIKWRQRRERDRLKKQPHEDELKWYRREGLRDRRDGIRGRRYKGFLTRYNLPDCEASHQKWSAYKQAMKEGPKG
jgi:hypothetical protein